MKSDTIFIALITMMFCVTLGAMYGLKIAQSAIVEDCEKMGKTIIDGKVFICQPESGNGQ